MPILQAQDRGVESAFGGVARRGIEIEVNDRGVEQLVARRAHNPKVAGSSPAPATKKTASLVEAVPFYWKGVGPIVNF